MKVVSWSSSFLVRLAVNQLEMCFFLFLCEMLPDHATHVGCKEEVFGLADYEQAINRS